MYSVVACQCAVGKESVVTADEDQLHKHVASQFSFKHGRTLGGHRQPFRNRNEASKKAVVSLITLSLCFQTLGTAATQSLHVLDAEFYQPTGDDLARINDKFRLSFYGKKC